MNCVPDLGNDDDYSSPSSTSTSTSSSSSLNQSPPKNKSIMGEDDIVELLWKSGQVVRSTQTQRPSFTPPILRGSGSGSGGGGEENAPLPPLHSHLQQPSDQNLFIREDEMASWLHHPLHEDQEYRSSYLIHSGVVSIPFAQPHGSVSFTPPPPPSALYAPTAERPMGQVILSRRAENFINFSRFRGNINTGGRVEPAPPWLPVVRGSTQVGSSATPSSSATESCLTPATVSGGVSQTFAVPSLSGKAFETVCDIAGPSSSVVSRTETEPLQIQPPTETETAGDRKRKEREETADDTEETAEEARGSTSRKRSRATEMHNISERRRREKINEKMKALQELIPRCNKTDKASMLEDAIEYVKSLQTQIQMMSVGGGGMMPMMYTPNMQRFMPHTAMGMMGMNRPPFIPLPGTAIPRPAHHMAGQGPSYPAPPYPFPNIQAFDPSRVHLPSQQPDPVPNQPPFPGYLNPYSQFVGLHQMQQEPPPPPSQNQTTSQLSFSQASSSKEPEDQENKPTG